MGKDSLFKRKAKTAETRRRQQRIATAAARTRDDAAPPPPTSIHDVPDSLLELILLRVRTPACLFRAAATCKPWRRLIAGAGGLLPRFRSLHRGTPRHLLLGHYCVNVAMATTEYGLPRLHATPPPRPLSTNNNLPQRLSLDFLHERAVFTDSHGGLLAFVRANWYAVVCDPWTREYREIRFPWGDASREQVYHCIGAFLLDAGGDDNDGGGNGDGGGSLMSSFRVLCACLVMDYVDDRIEAHACVFSARHNRWLPPASVCRNVGRGHWTGGVFLDPLDIYKRIMGRAGGSIFWYGVYGHVLAIDEVTGAFSTIRLPGAPENDFFCRVHRGCVRDNVSRSLRVVGSGGGGDVVRIVRVVDGELEVVRRDDHGGVWEWTVERRVGLCQLANIGFRPDLSWRFLDTAMASAAAELVLEASSFSTTVLLFSLDVETMKLQRVDESVALIADAERVFPYELPWRQQTISACV